jgi:hypothetical protein
MSDEIIPDQNTKQVDRGKCGIVMPISATDGYPPEHWQDVLQILKEVATISGFDPLLVSDANDVGIIQQRIIWNLYSNEIVICDVSSKNPNVMFELGLRLAFDKPTIIIKDHQTDYSFDTASIEHLTYPKDLRYSTILTFRSDLESKLKGTWKRFNDDPNASTFLKAFGPIHIATLETKEVSTDQLVLDEIREIRTELAAIRHVLQPMPAWAADPFDVRRPQRTWLPGEREFSELFKNLSQQERLVADAYQKIISLEKTGPEDKMPDLES